MSHDPQSPTDAADFEEDIDDTCVGCGDGDTIPGRGYFHCPICDAEWNEDDE